MSHGPLPSDIFCWVARSSRTLGVTLHSKGGGTLSVGRNSSRITGTFPDGGTPGGFNSGGGTSSGGTACGARCGRSGGRDTRVGGGSGAAADGATGSNGRTLTAA